MAKMINAEELKIILSGMEDKKALKQVMGVIEALESETQDFNIMTLLADKLREMVNISEQIGMTNSAMRARDLQKHFDRVSKEYDELLATIKASRNDNQSIV